jgi:DNA-binding NtrC family response regulator
MAVDFETRKQAHSNVLWPNDSAFTRKNISNIGQARWDGHQQAVTAMRRSSCTAASRYSLLDITMPLLDGVDTLRKIVERDKNAKVIMVSSIGHKEMIWRALCLGAKHFITKPYNPQYAGLIIKSILDGKGGTALCDTTT